MPRILIVDDESSIRFAVGSFFEAKGFEVALADSFATCVASYRADPPDAVILITGSARRAASTCSIS